MRTIAFLLAAALAAPAPAAAQAAARAFRAPSSGAPVARVPLAAARPGLSAGAASLALPARDRAPLAAIREQDGMNSSTLQPEQWSRTADTRVESRLESGARDGDASLDDAIAALNVLEGEATPRRASPRRRAGGIIASALGHFRGRAPVESDGAPSGAAAGGSAARLARPGETEPAAGRPSGAPLPAALDRTEGGRASLELAAILGFAAATGIGVFALATGPAAIYWALGAFASTLGGGFAGTAKARWVLPAYFATLALASFAAIPLFGPTMAAVGSMFAIGALVLPMARESGDEAKATAPKAGPRQRGYGTLAAIALAGAASMTVAFLSGLAGLPLTLALAYPAIGWAAAGAMGYGAARARFFERGPLAAAEGPLAMGLVGLTIAAAVLAAGTLGFGAGAAVGALFAAAFTFAMQKRSRGGWTFALPAGLAALVLVPAGYLAVALGLPAMPVALGLAASALAWTRVWDLPGLSLGDRRTGIVISLIVAIVPLALTSLRVLAPTAALYTGFAAGGALVGAGALWLKSALTPKIIPGPAREPRRWGNRQDGSILSSFGIALAAVVGSILWGAASGSLWPFLALTGATLTGLALYGAWLLRKIPGEALGKALPLLAVAAAAGGANAAPLGLKAALLGAASVTAAVAFVMLALAGVAGLIPRKTSKPE